MLSIEQTQGLFTGIIISAVVALCSSLFTGYFFQRYQYIHQLKMFEIQTKYSSDMVSKNEVINFLKESKRTSTIYLIGHFLLYAILFSGIFVSWQVLFAIPTPTPNIDNFTCLNQSEFITQNLTNVTNYYNVTVNEISINRKPSVVSVEELKYLMQK